MKKKKIRDTRAQENRAEEIELENRLVEMI